MGRLDSNRSVPTGIPSLDTFIDGKLNTNHIGTTTQQQWVYTLNTTLQWVHIVRA